MRLRAVGIPSVHGGEDVNIYKLETGFEHRARPEEHYLPLTRGVRKPRTLGRGKHDHNHVTHSVRGILCPACNRAIGFFNDNPKTCRRAAEYLELDGAFDLEVYHLLAQEQAAAPFKIAVLGGV